MKKYLVLSFFFIVCCISGFCQTSFSRLYGASLEMNLFSVEPTSDKGYILAGGVYGLNGGDFIIIKTDSLGIEQWRYKNNQFDGDFFENYALKAKETPDKGFIVFGDITVSLTNPFDMFIAKFDSTGALKWKRQYNLDLGEFSSDFIINSDTSLVFVGKLQGKAFLMKTNFQGDTIWVRKLINDSTDITNFIKIYSWDNAYYIPRIQGNSNNSNYGLMELFKIDTTGSIIWKKQYTDTARTWSFGDFRLSNDSNILNLNTMNWGNNYYFTQLNKFDLAGNKISSKKIKTGVKFINDTVCGAAYGAGDTLRFSISYLIPDTMVPIAKFYLYNLISRSLIIVGNKKIVACGKAENGFSGYHGYLAVAVDTTIVGINETSIEKEIINIFPNPAKNEINLVIDNSLLVSPKNLIFKVYDNNSKELISKTISSPQTIVNTEKLYCGEYFYLLTSEQKKIASGKIIIY
ncbi:MAG: T9SS type A sorting domain-containing protein [Bacteroidetes bacterium]|nr:T9SS type A sorting domain-containing protein [Bacteroidota bacterium]